MSGTKPTPGPWVLAGRYIQGPEQDIGDGDVGRLNIATCAVDWSSNGDPEQQANARLIVRAVNCHADLVAALEAYEREREDMEDRAPTYPECIECNLGTGPHKRTCAHHLARAALAKALEP